jgi:hypothetical protein
MQIRNGKSYTAKFNKVRVKAIMCREAIFKDSVLDFWYQIKIKSSLKC